MTETLVRSSQLVTQTCPNCGVLHAFPQALDEHARAKHSLSIWCPNGHAWHYVGPTPAEELSDQLKREREARARTAAERDQIEGSLRATKGVVTRLKNRAKAGVCPVDSCHRHFQNLERHIASRHPGWSEP